MGCLRSGFEGVPNNAMEWVEDWDKFDDEGACTRMVVLRCVMVHSSTFCCYAFYSWLCLIMACTLCGYVLGLVWARGNMC